MNESIDNIITESIKEIRFANSLGRDATKLLEQLRREITAKLDDNLSSYSRKRLNALLKDINDTIEGAYGAMSTQYNESVDGLVIHVAEATQAAMTVATVLPPVAVLNKLSVETITQGATLKEWWDKLSSDTKFRVATQIRLGIASNETGQQIIRRVTDAMEISKANAAAIVQTSVQEVNNKTREAFYAENDDVVGEIQFFSSMDSKVCPRCGLYDHKRWKNDGKMTPIGHGYAYVRPPLHVSCRCVSLPLTSMSEKVMTVRASMDGQVSAKFSFEDWLNRQSKERQEEVLGKGRTELFRQKKITLKDLIDGDGKNIKLADLKK